MKTERWQLRLDADQRRMLNALSGLYGKSASATVRRLILAAYRQAFGDERPAMGTASPNGIHKAGIRTASASVVATDENEENLSTDEILARAGIPDTDNVTGSETSITTPAERPS